MDKKSIEHKGYNATVYIDHLELKNADNELLLNVNLYCLFEKTELSCYDYFRFHEIDNIVYLFYGSYSTFLYIINCATLQYKTDERFNGDNNIIYRITPIYKNVISIQSYVWGCAYDLRLYIFKDENMIKTNIRNHKKTLEYNDRIRYLHNMNKSLYNSEFDIREMDLKNALRQPGTLILNSELGCEDEYYDYDFWDGYIYKKPMILNGVWHFRIKYDDLLQFYNL